MSKTIEGYAHIPGIQLAPGITISLGNWILRPLPFAEWLVLEDPALVFVEPAYTNVAPVFLTGPLIADTTTSDALVSEEGLEELSQQLRTVAQQVTHALLFSLWETLPDPSRSAMYLRLTTDKAQDNSICLFGTNERELLLIDYPPYATIAEEQQRDFCTVFAKFAAIGLGETTPEVLRLIDTIRLVNRPDTQILDLVLHFVMAQEDIFNAAATKPLGQTFARRMAALICNDFERLPEWHEAFGQLYKVRSDALHGRDPESGLSWLLGRFPRLELFLINWCNQTASLLSACLATCGGVEAGIKPLLNRLDRANDDRNEFDAIRAELDLNWLHT